MDFLFDLPAATAVLPVTHLLMDTNPAPHIAGNDVPNPPPPPKLIAENPAPNVAGTDVPNPPPPPK